MTDISQTPALAPGGGRTMERVRLLLRSRSGLTGLIIVALLAVLSLVSAFGLLPLPRRWFGGVRCREAWQGERYTFLVDVTLPWAGALIRYEGWLEPQ